MLQPAHGAPLFTIDLSPSRYCFFYLAIVHISLLISLFFYPFGNTVQGGFIVLLLWHWWFSCRKYNTADQSHRVSRLQHQRDGLYLVVGEQAVPVFIQVATVWRWAVFITLKTVAGRKCYRLAILPDSADAEQQRQLRVFLRHCLKTGV